MQWLFSSSTLHALHSFQENLKMLMLQVQQSSLVGRVQRPTRSRLWRVQASQLAGRQQSLGRRCYNCLETADCLKSRQADELEIGTIMQNLWPINYVHVVAMQPSYMLM
jgi:hypothetical protein